MIDDVTNTNLRYVKEFVKDDSSLIGGKILDHGTFIFTSNDADHIRQEESKRMVVFTVKNQMDEDTASRRDAALKKLRDKIHNALYRAYLVKIFPAVAELEEEIIAGGSDSSRKFFLWTPRKIR